MITIGKTKSVCPECMKVVPAIKGIGEDGIYLVKECNAHGKFQTLIWGKEMQQIIFTVGEEENLYRQETPSKSEG